jgi:hypothetical protein
MLSPLSPGTGGGGIDGLGGVIAGGEYFLIGPRSQFLLSIASPSLGDLPIEPIDQGLIGSELQELLAQRNGFYAFESALFVRGFGPAGGDIVRWNRDDSWRDGYGEDALGLFFFAEDVFGSQFAIQQDIIVQFDAETGSKTRMASSMEDFVDQLLDDYNYLTGYPLAKEWQDLNGQLEPGQRLVAIQPFVLGGDFSVANLRVMRDDEAMAARSALEQQLRGKPDGTKFRVEPTG